MEQSRREGENLLSGRNRVERKYADLRGDDESRTLKEIRGPWVPYLEEEGRVGKLKERVQSAQRVRSKPEVTQVPARIPAKE